MRDELRFSHIERKEGLRVIERAGEKGERVGERAAACSNKRVTLHIHTGNNDDNDDNVDYEGVMVKQKSWHVCVHACHYMVVLFY